jgi:GNAT superfamily N-acetyltransferase
LVTIRHVVFGERGALAEFHPELVSQYPKFVSPYLAGATVYRDDFPYAFYALEDGVVATYLNSFPDTLHWHENQYGWAWNANLFTDPRFRGRGLARKIIEYQLRLFAQHNLVWGGTFSSPAALSLYRKLGFNVVGAAPRMCLLRNPRAFLDHHVSSGAVVRLLSASYQLAYNAAKPIISGRNSFKRDYSIEPLSVEQFVALRRGHQLQYRNRAHWNDDPALLQAKMAVRNSDQVALVRDSSGRPLLYFLWRVRNTAERPIKEKYSGVKLFSVMDFGYLASPVDSQVLIQAATALFDRADADLLEVITYSPELERAARRRGFFSLGSGMSFTFKAPPGHALAKVRSKIEDWCLTHYSGDGYSFE